MNAEFAHIPRFLVIAGPTASGKSRLAMAVAQRVATEIVSCDSVQVYRGFDIGSAKPNRTERCSIPHHMVDLVDAADPFDAHMYQTEARKCILRIADRGSLPIVVGGSGLYLRALLGNDFDERPKDPLLREQLTRKDNLELWQILARHDPIWAKKIHINDKFRLIRALEILTLKPSSLKQVSIRTKNPWRRAATIVKLIPTRPKLHSLIAERTRSMLEMGLVAETEALIDRGVPTSAKPLKSIGYKQVIDFLQGRLSESELPDRINAATRQYAKRQCTWFRKVDADQAIESEEAFFAWFKTAGFREKRAVGTIDIWPMSQRHPPYI